MKDSTKYIALCLIGLIIGLVPASLLVPGTMVRPLTSEPVKEEVHIFNWETWVAGDFQSDVEYRLSRLPSMRPFLVRLHHETDYAFFGNIHSPNVVAGRGKVLFEQDYIDELTGRLFLGTDIWEREAVKLAQVTETLRDSFGIKLMLLIPPGKARILMDGWEDHSRGNARTNYSEMLRCLKRTGIQVLDMHPVIEAWTDTSRYPLFTNGGGHWSEYASALSADTILSWMAAQAGLPAPVTRLTGFRVSNIPWGLDNDLGWMANTFTTHLAGPMAYPEISIGYDTAWEARRWLIVGDSYADQMVFANYFIRMRGGDPELWTYNHNVLIDREYTDFKTGPGSLRKQVNEGCRYILLCLSERFMHTLFWGLTDDLEAMVEGQPVSHHVKVRNDILASREWFRYVANKACCRGWSVSHTLEKEAQSWLDGSSNWLDLRERQLYLPEE